MEANGDYFVIPFPQLYKKILVLFSESLVGLLVICIRHTALEKKQKSHLIYIRDGREWTRNIDITDNPLSRDRVHFNELWYYSVLECSWDERFQNFVHTRYVTSLFRAQPTIFFNNYID